MNNKIVMSLRLFSNALAAKFLLVALMLVTPFLYGGTITVEQQPRQPIRLGIDAERLWYWNPSNAKALARLAVGELEVEYARVAMVPAYERERGVINERAYEKTLALMASFKAENPRIKFFATPQPIDEAYTDEESLNVFNRPKPPWAPYPIWINEFVADGKDADGYTKWAFSQFHAGRAARYLADYLNLMHRNGFSIDFMDLTNEFNKITPGDVKAIRARLPRHLDTGVKLPLFISSSSGSFQSGVDWLNAVDLASGEEDQFDIAGVHNTFDDAFVAAADFVTKARQLGKPVWSTEMHKWVGATLTDEIESSSFLWNHFRLGFTGIDTWLFFGNIGNTNHPMILSNGSGVIQKLGKYEIFKRLVNSVNGGRYVNTSALNGVTTSAAFVKGNVMQVWVLNNNEADAQAVNVDLNGRTIVGSNITKTVWHHTDSGEAGTTTVISKADNNSFQQWIHGNSLYCFEFNVASQ
jgi:hypothetical protein